MGRKIFPLILLSSVLLSVPYLVPGTGWLSLVAFVPLLWAEDMASTAGLKRFCWWHYLCFVLWNAFTTFWVCNATVGGGIFAVLANALQMSLVFGLFRWSRKSLGNAFLPYVFLAFAWVGWERAYLTFLDISWPWLVLGNAFARTTDWIQWYEITGHLGGSLWIWATNLAVFGLMKSLATGNWKNLNVKAKTFAAGGTVLLFLAPPLVSLALYPAEDEDNGQMNVVIAQPNIDPYNKFGGMTQSQQNELLLSLFSKVPTDSSMTLLVAPETFTNDVIVNDIASSPTVSRFTDFLEARPNSNLLFGTSCTEFVHTIERPSHTARQLRDGRWYERHNSAIMLDGRSRPQIFHKSKLVPGVEMTPYPAFFCKVDDLLGGLMGRNVGQEGISLLNANEYDSSGHKTASVPIGCAICYESVYGDYCAGYARKGAQALTIITNDAWWKDTPGYRQHLSYASLRAIETRRWIARCGNTGISAIIDPSGRILDRTGWWQEEVLQGTIGLRDETTFFVRHGDFIGRISLLMAVLIFLGALVRSRTSR